MLKLPAFWIMAAAVYVFFGLLWSVSFGIHSMELRDSRERDYSFDFFELLSADFNGQELWLCVNGRQIHHSAEPAEESQFAVAGSVESGSFPAAPYSKRCSPMG